jgi:hypothetical protein
MNVQDIYDSVSTEVNRRIRNGETLDKIGEQKLNLWIITVAEWIFGKKTTQRMIKYVLGWYLYYHGQRSDPPVW